MDVFADRVLPCNDQIFFELASDVEWDALFQVKWLTTRKGRQKKGGQTSKVWMLDLGD